MNTRSLAARLKRLEFRTRPGFQVAQINICIVNCKGQASYTMRLAEPENQYFLPDGSAITKDEAHRLHSRPEEAIEPASPGAHQWN